MNEKKKIAVHLAQTINENTHLLNQSLSSPNHRPPPPPQTTPFDPRRRHRSAGLELLVCVIHCSPRPLLIAIAILLAVIEFQWVNWFLAFVGFVCQLVLFPIKFDARIWFPPIRLNLVGWRFTAWSASLRLVWFWEFDWDASFSYIYAVMHVIRVLH